MIETKLFHSLIPVMPLMFLLRLLEESLTMPMSLLLEIIVK